jgi:hypothetical protein
VITEAAAAQKETESPRHESAPTAPKVALTGDFAAVTAAGFLGDVALSGRANAGVRTLAMRQTQQTHGNHFAQRAIAGRFIQRHCSCGGTCEKCRAEEEGLSASPAESTEESTRLVQREAVGPSTLATTESNGNKVIPPGSGESIDEKTRAFMESRFDRDFGKVRVHTDTAAAASAETLSANAYTSGRDIYFAPGKYAPETREGQHLLAHELAHTVQQSEGSLFGGVAMHVHDGILVGRADDPLEGEADRVAHQVIRTPTTASAIQAAATTTPLVQRQANRNRASGLPKTYSTTTAKTLIEDTPTGDVPGKITSDHGQWLDRATDAERIALLAACLWSESFETGQAIDLIWFHCKNWQALARANDSIWKRSLTAMIESSGYFFRNLMDAFLFDTEEVARGYLDMNETYCVTSLAEMAYDREGKPIIGPPSAVQKAARENPVEIKASRDLVALQERLQATRKIIVGYHKPYKSESDYEGTLPPGGTGTHYDPIWFTPEADPQAAEPPREGDGGLPWPVVKKGYDEGVHAIRRILSLHPKLYVLVREKYEDTSKTAVVADDKSPDRSDTLELVAKELAETVKNIEKVRPLMGKAIAEELAPIHEQLLTGNVTSPRHPNRNWMADPVWKPVADAYVEHTKPRPWWEHLGLATLEMAVFVIAGMATGGVGFAVAMAVKGSAEAAMAAGKSQLMTAASMTNVTEETKLVTSRQVEEAETEAEFAAAFAVLDALTVGIELRAVSAAARLAKLPGMQATRAIELSERVLQYEKKLLGRVSAEEVETAAKEARALASDARRLAEEASAVAEKGGDSAARSRARLAGKAAERAEEAAKRVESLADDIKRAKQAIVGIPEEQLVPALEVPLPDGGKLVITKTGQVFLCASPCSRIVDKFADVIGRNPLLAKRAKAFESAESQAQAALTDLKGSTEQAVKTRLKELAKEFEKECVRYKKAEFIVEWLQTVKVKYPALQGKPLDADAIARVLEKGPSDNKVKGQLLEELGQVKIETLLGSNKGRAELAGEFAGEELVFIPGHRLRDSQGRELTDGLVGFWKGDTFQIVTIIEAKAGIWASEGLRYGEAELSAVRSARHRLMMPLWRGNPAAAKAIREMSFADFIRAHRKEVEEALREAESDSDWAMHALEEVQTSWKKELLAAGKNDEAKEIAQLGTSAFKAKYPQKAAEAEELIPLPEAGQFTRDLERTEQIGGKIIDTGELPTIVEDRKLAKAWKGKGVPAGVGKPTRFAGQRGSVRMQGFTTSDVDASKLAEDIQTVEKLQTNVTKVGLSSNEMETLANDILAQARVAPK